MGIQGLSFASFWPLVRCGGLRHGKESRMMHKPDYEGWVVYQQMPRFGIIEKNGKMVRVDLEMPHLEVEPENGHSSQMMALGKYAKYVNPEQGQFKVVVNQYGKTFKKVQEVDRITEVYKPLDPGTWVFRFGEEWLKIEPSSGLLMLFRKQDQMFREIERHVSNGHFTLLDKSKQKLALSQLDQLLDQLSLTV